MESILFGGFKYPAARIFLVTVPLIGLIICGVIVWCIIRQRSAYDRLAYRRFVSVERNYGAVTSDTMDYLRSDCDYDYNYDDFHTEVMKQGSVQPPPYEAPSLACSAYENYQYNR